MEYYNNVIQHLQWQVMEIQMNGMLVDMDRATAMRELADAKYKEYNGWINEALGYKLNPNSPKQVLECLTKDLGLSIPQVKKDGIWRDSTDELSLLKATIPLPQALPVVEALIACRDVRKKSGTYLNPVPWRDGRVRSQFRLYGTLTWRLSSRDPNLQNLPRRESHGIDVKSMYIAPPGTRLVELDYSALEDRIPSYASGCKTLIDLFDTGANVHLYRANEMFGGKWTNKKECPTEYDLAKRTRYAKGYGASALKVSDTLFLEMHKYFDPSFVAALIDKMDATMPEVIAWHNWCWEEAEKTGIVYDGFGTPRILYSPKRELRQTAYSWPTQATASGIMNRSLVRIYHAKRAGLLRSDTRCICQVHDSLVFEIHEDHVESEARIIKALMEEPVTIFGRRTVFPVEAKSGSNWSEMKEMRFAA